jgi:hypothetical protein
MNGTYAKPLKNAIGMHVLSIILLPSVQKLSIKVLDRVAGGISAASVETREATSPNLVGSAGSLSAFAGIRRNDHAT